MKNKIINFLFDYADPSIILRVKKEILNCLSEKEEKELLGKIISQKNVQTVIQSQKSDGWFGNNFHGQSPKNNAGMYDNMEVGLRYLAEKGFSSENEYISKAVSSFLSKEPFDAAYGCGKPETPEADYKYTASGLYIARSSIILRAGYENKLPENDFIDLKRDVDFSFKTFADVLNYATADEIIDRQKKKPCFKENILFPCLYHLRMLAHSVSWRNSSDISILVSSLNHLLSFQQTDEMVYTYIKGQYRGPCFALIHAQGRILGIAEKDFIPLDMMELFARCKVVKGVELLKYKYDRLLSLIDENLNVNIDSQNGNNWNPYLGFALEVDWKKKIRLQCDLLFRVLLIMHYTEMS